jgi:hypothetical protein
MQKNAFAHADQVYPLLAVLLAIINGLDGEEITDRLRGLIESDAVIAPVARGFIVPRGRTPLARPRVRHRMGRCPVASVVSGASSLSCQGHTHAADYLISLALHTKKSIFW